MPGKAGRGQGKHPTRSKKRKGRRDLPAPVAQQQAASPAREPTITPGVSSPVISAPTTRARPTFARYPHIAAELRRIGILAGIMVVILVVLALVLS